MEGGTEGRRAGGQVRTGINHFAAATVVYLNEFLTIRCFLSSEVHALLSFVVRKRLQVLGDGRSRIRGGGASRVVVPRGRRWGMDENGEEEEEEEEEDSTQGAELLGAAVKRGGESVERIVALDAPEKKGGPF